MIHYMVPRFLRILSDPEVKNVLIVGCWGGFDFVHGMLLYPMLRNAAKNIVIGSYSFGLPQNLPVESPRFESESDLEVRIVNGSMKPDPHYAPEVNLCNYLDGRFPETNHEVYAYYARDCTVNKLTLFYEKLCIENQIDTVIAIDGGSDSLMVGDEAGIGDVVEDLVSITAIDSLKYPERKILLNVGLGVDRYNDVSDASALRAVAELTKSRAYLGCIGIEPDSPDYRFYRSAVEHIHQRQSFKSTVTDFVSSSVEGYYGHESSPNIRLKDNSETGYFIWPMMSMIWAFDLPGVAKRSKIPEAIFGKTDLKKTWQAVTDLEKVLKIVSGLLRIFRIMKRCVVLSGSISQHNLWKAAVSNLLRK